MASGSALGANTVDRETSHHHVGDTGANGFTRQRNQIGVGRDAGYFAIRFRFAFYALQTAWLANLKTLFGLAATSGEAGGGAL